MDIAGSNCLVTGANRGIGLAITQALLQADAAKVYAACRDVDAANRVAAESDRLVALHLDVTDPAQVQNAVAACPDLDVLVNNAGVNFNQPVIGAADPDIARSEIEVNYLAVLDMCRSFAPVLGANGGGAIVNILSILSRVNLPMIGTYCASKAAAYSATQALRAQLAPQGTQVFAVMPGAVDTRINDGMEIDKMPAAEVADALIAGLESDTQDIYPGEAAQGLAAGLAADPAGVVAQMAKMIP